MSEPLIGGPIWSTDARAYRTRVRRDLRVEVQPLIEAAERDREFPRLVITRLGQLGHFEERWSVAGPYGDLGRAVILADELGRLLTGGLTAGISLHGDSALAILRCPDGPGSDLFRAAAAGRTTVCLAVTEPTGGSDLTAIQTTAARLADGSWELTGEKKFVSLARSADFALVLARTGRDRAHLTFFAVPNGPDGYEVSADLAKLGTRSVETCELELRGVQVAADHVVGRVGAGLVVFSRAMTAERVALCAQLVGAVGACLDLLRTHLRQRRSGTGVLWDHQALRHRFADLIAEQRVLSSAVVATASAVQAGEVGHRDVAALKLYVAPRVQRAVADVMEMFGGVGYLEDLPIERALRDVTLARIGAGTDDIMREIVAQMAFPLDEAF